MPHSNSSTKLVIAKPVAKQPDSHSELMKAIRERGGYKHKEGAESLAEKQGIDATIKSKSFDKTSEFKSLNGMII